MTQRKSKEIAIHRFLVLCEGESECIYLEEYKKDKARDERIYSIEIDIYQPENYSPLGLVNEAKERIKESINDELPYEYVWVVFDKDQHPYIPDAFNESNKQIPKINIAFSVICFEYWILLHFEKTTSLFLDCDEVIRYIKQKKYITDYKKTDFYSYIENKIPEAIKNAKLCVKQNQIDIKRGKKLYQLSAYTDFHKLLDNIDKFLKEHFG